MGKLIVEQSIQSVFFFKQKTAYEIFAAHWPRVTDPNDPVAAKLNSMQKYVASRTLHRVEWHNSTLLPGDAAGGCRAAQRTSRRRSSRDRQLQPDPVVVEARPRR